MTFQDHCGLASARDAQYRVRTDDRHANVNDTVHGGLLATMLDCAMGQAIRDSLPDGQKAATVTMTVTYLRPARLGDELRAVAAIRRQGDSLVMAEAQVLAGHGEDEKAVADAVGTFTVIDGD